MSKLTKTVALSEGAGSARACARREEAIRASVLAALGSPAELLRVTVVPLWGDKLRVNVWTSGSAGASIPNSFFVTADESGSVLTSEPPIQKQY
jgi:hypothetical protein